MCTHGNCSRQLGIPNAPDSGRIRMRGVFTASGWFLGTEMWDDTFFLLGRDDWSLFLRRKENWRLCMCRMLQENHDGKQSWSVAFAVREGVGFWTWSCDARCSLACSVVAEVVPLFLNIATSSRCRLSARPISASSLLGASMRVRASSAYLLMQKPLVSFVCREEKTCSPLRTRREKVCLSLWRCRERLPCGKSPSFLGGGSISKLRRETGQIGWRYLVTQ